MGKKKKKKKKVNPEESNKMVWAIGVGLLILMFVFVFLTSKRSEPKPKEELVKAATEYFTKNPGIIEVKFNTETNHLMVIYNGNIKDDYYSMAMYAGKSLLDEIQDEKIHIVLAKDSAEDPIYRFTFSRGQLLEEKKY